MKTARMVIGIISMVLFLLITFQSCAAGISNTMNENGEAGGSAGVFLALFMLVAGIIGVAARNSAAGSITAGCFYAVGGLVAIPLAGTYSDLKIWGGLSIIFGIVFIVLGIVQKKKTKSQ